MTRREGDGGRGRPPLTGREARPEGGLYLESSLRISLVTFGASRFAVSVAASFAALTADTATCFA